MAKLPVADFLTERLSEYDSTFSVRPGTGFHRLFFKPMQYITQPIIDEADRIRTAQSLLRILETDDPDAFDEDEVDALVANVYITRFTGDFSSGTARVYYPEAVSREWPANGILITGSNGVTYTNPSPFVITQAQMGQQIEDGNFYYDIPIVSADRGDGTELEAEQLVSVANDPTVISVTNKNAISGGRDRETNTELIERARSSIGVRTLSVGKGFRGTLFDAFPSFLLELQPIGFGDKEMMRDVVFNTHIGGKTDGYFKAASITTGSKSFIGLLLDETRQTVGNSNVELTASDWADLGYPNIDRSNSKDPIVREVKANFPAEFTSTADLSAPIDLSTNQHIKLTIDGVAKNIRVAGLSPASTSRNEIVSIINASFGVNVAFTVGTQYILLRSPSEGLSAQIVIDNPDVGNSALLEVFGLATGDAPFTYDGEGPITFIEGTHYNIDDANGRIRRIIGAEVIAAGASGSTLQGTNQLTSSGLFGSVSVNDIVTVTGTSPDVVQQDYRVLEVTDANTLVLDDVLAPGDTDGTPHAVEFGIRRTGIKNEELVEVEFYFNPLSIDIGDQVVLDEETMERGIRPGREAQTITDLSFLRITSIEIIDPITEEPTGEVLSGESGWGLGGWGEGPWGVGDSSDYYLVVNEPTARFSAYEDSYIVLNSGLIGLSFVVNYEYVPQVRDLHAFALSESERDIGGDILMKTFIPAYVEGTIRYSVSESDAAVIPDNETIQADLRKWIYELNSAPRIEISDIIQFILRRVDPFDKYGAYVEPFSLSATVENTDGTTAGVESDDILEIPEEDPFPKFTERPLSPKIARWIAQDLVLERI